MLSASIITLHNNLWQSSWLVGLDFFLLQKLVFWFRFRLVSQTDGFWIKLFASLASKGVPNPRNNVFVGMDSVFIWFQSMVL